MMKFLIVLSILQCLSYIKVVQAQANETYTESKGVLSSPNYPDSFPKVKNAYLVELIDNSSVILLEFTKLDLRSYDRDTTLKIYDGASETAPLLRSFTDALHSDIRILSTGNQLYLVLDAVVQGETNSGFYAVYDTVTQQYSLNNETGTFSSPNYPGDYNNSDLIIWKIQSSENEFVRLEIDDFETEACCDYLEVRNGLTFDDTLIGNYSGISDSRIGPIVATTNGLLIKFTTDGSGTSRGFSATYYPGFQENLGHQFGEFHSINHPENYTGWYAQKWVIEIPESANRIYLEFKTFETESNVDVLQIYDGVDENSRLVGEYSGNSLPPAFVSTSNKLFLRFTSDGKNEYPGFSARYEDVPNSFTTTDRPICTADGVYSVPFPGECGKYYLCVNYEEYEQSCSDGLYFDPQLGECNLAENVNCEWAPTTTPSPSICPPEGIVFLPTPGNCSAYILCANGIPSDHLCPHGTLFDPVELKCKTAEEVNCPIVCPSEGIQYFPNPSDCSKYTLCTEGVSTEHTCPDGTLFDPEELKCKAAADVICSIKLQFTMAKKYFQIL